MAGAKNIRFIRRIWTGFFSDGKEMTEMLGMICRHLEECRFESGITLETKTFFKLQLFRKS